MDEATACRTGPTISDQALEPLLARRRLAHPGDSIFTTLRAPLRTKALDPMDREIP